jgi:hypothetical protein
VIVHQLADAAETASSGHGDMITCHLPQHDCNVFDPKRIAGSGASSTLIMVNVSQGRRDDL